MVRLSAAGPELTGPCGPGPWYVEIRDDEDPVDVVRRLSTNLMGPPLLVHSTSWRRARGAVILSFLVVTEPDQTPELGGVPIGRHELARGGATDAAPAVLFQQVLEHGIRHLAWLAQDDEVVRATLSEPWKRALATYVPEPFRHLG